MPGNIKQADVVERITKILWKCDNFNNAAENLENEFNNILSLATGSIERIRKEIAFSTKLEDFESTITFLTGRNLI